MKLKRIFLLAAGLVFAIYNAEASDNVTWNVTIANNTSATIYLGGTPEGRAHCWDLSPERYNQLSDQPLQSLKAREEKTFSTIEIGEGVCSHNWSGATNYMEFFIDGQVTNGHLVKAYVVSLNSVYPSLSEGTATRKIVYNGNDIAHAPANSHVTNVRIDYNGGGNLTAKIEATTPDRPPNNRL